MNKNRINKESEKELTEEQKVEKCRKAFTRGYKFGAIAVKIVKVLIDPIIHPITWPVQVVKDIATIKPTLEAGELLAEERYPMPESSNVAKEQNVFENTDIN